MWFLMVIPLICSFQASEVTFKEENIGCFDEVKKIEAKARLVRSGSLPLHELGKLKAYILNSRSEGQQIKDQC